MQLFAPVIAPWLLEQIEIFVYVLKNQHPTGVVYVQVRSIFADQSQTFVCVFILQEKEGKGKNRGSKHRTWTESRKQAPNIIEGVINIES